MSRAHLLTATAAVEAGAALLLLAWPAAFVELILGVGELPPAAGVVARIAGAALLAVAVACWRVRGAGGPAELALVAGALIYDVAAAAILAYAGLALNLTGVALWPGVAFHVAMTAWCVACLRR